MEYQFSLGAGLICSNKCASTLLASCACAELCFATLFVAFTKHIKKHVKTMPILADTFVYLVFNIVFCLVACCFINSTAPSISKKNEVSYLWRTRYINKV